MNAHGLLMNDKGSIVVSGDVRNKVNGYLANGWIKTIDETRTVRVSLNMP
jgi:hypothetical protein